MPLRANLFRKTCLAVAICLTGMATSGISTTRTPAQDCERAAVVASQRHDVPLDVMLAIAHVESGRTQNGQLRPWPWALHAQGQGQWFDNAGAALARARDLIAGGTRNVDLGCFQVNYHWHGDKFPSLDAMIAPASNADYAARLLRDHFDQLGNWEAAAARYHSATPHLAERYLARFRSAQAGIHPGELPHDTMLASAHHTDRVHHPAPPQNKQNSFVLLRPASSGTLGSLVPSTTTAGQTRSSLIDLSPDTSP